ncbi:MAG: hypothetical protein A3F12_00340 [Gammaproteobacteria bacterium RIFCSPHIGHO2_12_FULL_38_14]|nr:MAG: hypothetical protein A3F12_00340 [Gammaproteobacteria bacterium RIFCSPHIGHO2_12_FULL_38_14]
MRELIFPSILVTSLLLYPNPYKEPSNEMKIPYGRLLLAFLVSSCHFYVDPHVPHPLHIRIITPVKTALLHSAAALPFFYSLPTGHDYLSSETRRKLTLAFLQLYTISVTILPALLAEHPKEHPRPSPWFLIAAMCATIALNTRKGTEKRMPLQSATNTPSASTR